MPSIEQAWLLKGRTKWIMSLLLFSSLRQRS